MKKLDSSQLPIGTSSETEKQTSLKWFRDLRDNIVKTFEQIENEARSDSILPEAKFERKNWVRDGGGGGEISIMRGHIFEKVGVNISTVYGELSEEFRSNIPGTEKNSSFWASGISVVAHMQSPLIPAVHMNTRHIVTTKRWFGGGADITPSIENDEQVRDFHKALREACDRYNPEYYEDFKSWCDKYFYLPHRQEHRGAGGIFYDYLNTNDFSQDFNFTKDVGETFLKIYPEIVKKNMRKKWTKDQKNIQLEKRGRYVEFNLLYDRGTQFGLKIGGNIDAILMSMPPEVRWN